MSDGINQLNHGCDITESGIEALEFPRCEAKRGPRLAVMASASSIWVAGEALIDLVPIAGERVAIVGGGPANTAKALARLGLTPSFIGGISSDDFGKAIEKELQDVAAGLSKGAIAGIAVGGTVAAGAAVAGVTVAVVAVSAAAGAAI